MSSSPDLAPAVDLPDEVDDSGDPTDDRWTALVERLSDQSVRKHFDAYVDVDWDGLPVDPTDPRWELSAEFDSLGATAWYQSQPTDVRARIGLHVIVAKAKAGLQFESILMRGLLNFADTLPNGSPEFRYCYHEVIEEGQHSLMFQELVNRSGIDVRGLGWRERLATPLIVSWARRFPELFFFFVLGGEDPIDHVQRQALRRGGAHPLLEQIMRIHVTEEARHLSFARHHLKRQVPRLSPARRLVLSLAVPRVLTEMSKMMLRPPAELIRTYSIPDEVITEAYVVNPTHRAEAAASVRKVRVLCRELGLINPVSRRLWKVGHLWAED